jgi:hypothetical protein
MTQTLCKGGGAVRKFPNVCPKGPKWPDQHPNPPPCRVTAGSWSEASRFLRARLGRTLVFSWMLDSVDKFAG